MQPQLYRAGATLATNTPRKGDTHKHYFLHPQLHKLVPQGELLLHIFP
jgi:hypothetical protein